MAERTESLGLSGGYGQAILTSALLVAGMRSKGWEAMAKSREGLRRVTRRWARGVCGVTSQQVIGERGWPSVHTAPSPSNRPWSWW